MVFILSVGLLCAYQRINLLAFQGDPLKSQSSRSVMSCKRMALWVFLRIMFFSKLIRTLNGHSARKTDQPAFLQRVLGITWLLLHGAAWLKQRGISVGRVEC